MTWGGRCGTLVGMKHCLLLLGIVALVACHKPAAQSFGVAVPGPANPVVPVDPSGNYPASFTTTNDAGNPLPVDTEPGTALSTLVVQPVPAVQQVLVDAGTRCIQGVAFTNEGNVTGVAQIYCGQYVTDAGGTATAVTAPSLQLRCPAGTICSISLQAPLCCAGATWYSSADAGYLVTASAPLMSLTAAALR